MNVRRLYKYIMILVTFEKDVHNGDGSVKIRIINKCVRIFLAVPYGTTRKIICTALSDSKIFINYEYITVF